MRRAVSSERKRQQKNVKRRAENVPRLLGLTCRGTARLADINGVYESKDEIHTIAVEGK
jgi:hypothetical protein